MTKVKESSTLQANKNLVFAQCPLTYVMDRIGGHWKPIILFHLLTGSKRYGELKRAIPAITEKMLIQHLKELEADRLVIRKAKPVVPPHVTYSLTPSGAGLKPVLYAMATWVVEESKRNSRTISRSLSDFPSK
ncbi:winged helix-turn-helix transcriptional regulator [Flavitalea flava]